MKYLLLFLSLLLVSGCQSSKPVIKQVEIRYSNGNLYLTGQYLCRGSKGDTLHVGIWKSYYATSILASEIEYDSSGEWIRYNFYYDDGRLSEIASDDSNILTFTSFDRDGKLIKTQIHQSQEDGENSTTSTLTQEYYSNGKLRVESHATDGNFNGLTTVWDTIGNQALKLNYLNGIIQQ